MKNSPVIEYHQDDYTISTDKDKLDLDAIHDYLSNHSYWASGRTLEAQKTLVSHCLCFGVYHKKEQIGFARVLTDYVTLAYLADVYILERHRGKGLSKKLMKAVVSHPELQHIRRFMLATRDAHKLYEKFGFKPLSKPERWMEIFEENP